MARVVFKDRKDNEINIIIMFSENERFLSNFWPCSVTLPEEHISTPESEIHLPEMAFTSVENAYMAWKTTDLEFRRTIQLITAKDAKNLALENKIPLRIDYNNENRLKAMSMLLEQKFSDSNPELKQLLIETAGVLIVEGNTWNDDFFGFCLNKGAGENHLGRMLMKRRDELICGK